MDNQSFLTPREARRLAEREAKKAEKQAVRIERQGVELNPSLLSNARTAALSAQNGGGIDALQQAAQQLSAASSSSNSVENDNALLRQMMSSISGVSGKNMIDVNKSMSRMNGLISENAQNRIWEKIGKKNMMKMSDFRKILISSIQ